MTKHKPYSDHKTSTIEGIEEIPTGWEVSKLSHLATFNKQTLPETTDPETKIRYIEISDVSSQNGITYHSPITFKEAPSRARRIVKQNDVLISTVRTYLRAVYGVEANFNNLIASTGFAVATPKNCNGGFLKYALLSTSFLDKVVSFSTGVSYPAIKTSLLSSFKIPVPPLETQHEIVEFLDAETAHIDAGIANMESLVTLLTEKRAALISEVTTRGIPGEHTTFKDSEVEWLGRIPASWTLSKVKSVIRVKKNSNKGMKNSNLLSLSYGALKKKDINSASGLLPDNFEGYQIIRPNEIVFRFTDLQNDQRSLRSAINKLEEGIITSAYMVVSVKNSKIMDHDFFAYLMRGYDHNKVFYGIGSGLRQSVGYKELSILPVPLPSLEAQQRIVEFLKTETERVDLAITNARSVIALLKEKRQVLISDVVTGKIDVTGSTN